MLILCLSRCALHLLLGALHIGSDTAGLKIIAPWTGFVSRISFDMFLNADALFTWHFMRGNFLIREP
ncbi:MAG: hypothetical protein MAG431_00365 [Chloroflexi bacterium]|nr:hypothetical protein [Chloroflexota bacterium]